MTQRLLGILTVACSISFAVFGCGSSSSNSSTVSAADALASCNAYCDAVIAKTCADPMFTSLADCKTSECDQLSQVPAKCQGAIKTYYDCEKTQSDICADSGCGPQFAALGTCQ